MNGWKLALISAALLVASAASAHSESETYILAVPPEFFGEPPATSAPGFQWAYISEFATQRECEDFKASGRYTIVAVDGDGKRTVKSLAFPSNAACITHSQYFR